MSRTYPQFKLRMPPALRLQLQKAAVTSRRSMNAELVHRLEASFATEVSTDESQQVSAPTASTGLRLLCLLVETRTGETRSLPVHTVQPVPPCNRIQGSWPDGRYPGFVLRETHAKRASAEVVARCARQWQTHTFRSNPRTIRA